MNKILRCILKVRIGDDYRPLISTNEMYKSLGLLKFKDVHRLYLLKFWHYCWYKNPHFALKYLTDNLPSHNYSTRNNIQIYYPEVRIDKEKQSTIYQICELANNIDPQLLQPLSEHSLKNIFKNSCIRNY